MHLPPDSVIAAVVERYADLIAGRRSDIGTRPLVLPNGDFFPDRFDKDEPSVTRLVSRMQAHAGIADIPVTCRIVRVEGEPASSGCSSGACATPQHPQGEVHRLIDDGERWTLQVLEAEVQAPVVLTTLAARALGHIFLAETARNPGDLRAPVEVTADLAAAALGFGPLLLEGAYIYSKSCGGPKVGCATHLSLAELSLATALFIEVGGHSARRALKELGVTQSETLSQALEWARSNETLVQRLRTEPARVAAGDFELRETRPWLLRVLGRKSGGGRPRDDFSPEQLFALEPTPSVTTPVTSRPKKPKSAADAELKALVDEVFSSPAPAQSD